MHYSSD